MGAPWTISPIPESDLEAGDLIQVTLLGGETRLGMISDVRPLPNGKGWTLTLWADPGDA